MTTYFELLKLGEADITSYSLEPRIESERILLDVFKLNKKDFLLNLSENIINKRAINKFFRLINIIKTGMPLSYVLNYSYFRNNKYYIRKGVLIPRPETELLIEHTIDAILSTKETSKQLVILEFGFGSGIISIELALRFPNAIIYAWDISATAHKVATINAKNLKTTNITFINNDFFKDQKTWEQIISPQKQVVFVGNPPYISLCDFEKLDANVKYFEPRSALKAGTQGLIYYKKIFDKLKNMMGIIALEFGVNQKNAIEEMLKCSHIKHYRFHNDLQNIPRVLIAKKDKNI